MKHKHNAPGVVRVYSKTLGEHIYFVPDTYQNGKLDGVTYTYTERHLLKGVTKEQLKTIHQAKKLFGGELVDLAKMKGVKPFNKV